MANVTPASSLVVNGSRHSLSPPGLVVGRGSEADLRINDPGVSRRHAEFRVSAEGGRTSVSVVDLGSTNGTLVGRQRIDEADLADADSGRVGNTDIGVNLDSGRLR